jgi:ankyrin repeat protein
MKKFKKGVSKKLYKSTDGYYKTITVEELNEFIQNGADPNYISDPDNYGASYSIIQNCSVNDDNNLQLKSLIGHGADPNLDIGTGDLPIYVAIRNKAINNVKLLIDSGANLEGALKATLESSHLYINDDNVEIIMEIIDILIKNNAGTIDDVINQINGYEENTDKNTWLWYEKIKNELIKLLK